MRLGRLFSALFIALAALISVASPASAHVDVVKTVPADGSDVAHTLPKVIEVTFNEAPLLDGSAIVLSDADGNEVALGELSLNGNTLNIGVPADLPSGKSTVTWRAASDDGHIATGSFSFTYTADGTAAVIASPDPAMTAYADDTLGEVEEAHWYQNPTWIILFAVFIASGIVSIFYVKKKNKTVD